MDDRPNRTDTELLGIYLNDHLTGATVGVDRAQSLVRAEAERDPALADTLRPVVDEIAEDRAHLLRIMRSLDVPVRRYRMVAGHLAERVGRLKANGRLVRRSPLTPMLELELLRLGVEGKAAGWRTLRRLADTDARLDTKQLDDLLDRAERQRDTLEQLRLRQIEETFRQTEDRPAAQGSPV
jgi:ribosomal protein L30/L7E